MINFNIKEDIFDSCLIFTDTKTKIVSYLNSFNVSSLQTFHEMANLYSMLKEYEQLCTDYKKCSGDYSKSLIENRLKELQTNIKMFYVLDTSAIRKGDKCNE